MVAVEGIVYWTIGCVHARAFDAGEACLYFPILPQVMIVAYTDRVVNPCELVIGTASILARLTGTRQPHLGCDWAVQPPWHCGQAFSARTAQYGAAFCDQTRFSGTLSRDDRVGQENCDYPLRTVTHTCATYIVWTSWI
jgi:hypothetical protein